MSVMSDLDIMLAEKASYEDIKEMLVQRRRRLSVEQDKLDGDQREEWAHIEGQAEALCYVIELIEERK